MRAKLAFVDPVEEVRAFLPQLKVQGIIPRMAVAVLFLVLVGQVPFSVRSTRQIYAAAKTPFNERSAAWDEDYQEQLDRDYRDSFKA